MQLSFKMMINFGFFQPICCSTAIIRDGRRHQLHICRSFYIFEGIDINNVTYTLRVVDIENVICLPISIINLFILTTFTFERLLYYKE